MGIYGKGRAACSRCLDLECLQEEDLVCSIKQDYCCFAPDDDDVTHAVN